MEPGPTISEESLVTVESTSNSDLTVSPIEKEAGPREKRNRRAPVWVKDYYTK